MMWRKTCSAMAGVAMAGVAGAAMAAGRGPMMPDFRGGWHPGKVGSGAVYEIQTPGQPAMTWEIALVGEEGDGHWMEMRAETPQGPMISKTLISPTGVKRMIVKMAQEPAIEMPTMAGAAKVPQSDIEQHQQSLGKESITTPAGTFQCDHYQVDGQDIWINTGVSPYGLVKASGPKSTMTLQKILSGVSSKITETPQQMPGMEQLFGSGGMPQLPAGLMNRVKKQ